MKKFCAVLSALVLVLSLSAVSFGAIPVKYSVVFPATGTQADGARLLGQIIEKVSVRRPACYGVLPFSTAWRQSINVRGLEHGDD